jgi:hypothetical protein
MNKNIIIVDRNTDILTPYKSVYEYRILGQPKKLLSTNNYSSRVEENKEKKYEYEYERVDKGNKLNVKVFYYLSDVFSYLANHKYYPKDFQIDGLFIYNTGYVFDTSYILNLCSQCYFSIPILEIKNLLNGEYEYMSIQEARRVYDLSLKDLAIRRKPEKTNKKSNYKSEDIENFERIFNQFLEQEEAEKKI